MKPNRLTSIVGVSVIVVAVALVVSRFRPLLEEGVHTALSGATAVMLMIVLLYGAMSGRLFTPTVQLIVFAGVLIWSVHYYLAIAGGMFPHILAGLLNDDRVGP